MTDAPAATASQSDSGATKFDARRALRRVLDTAASLKLTVVLLALSMVLIFAGTLAQVERGIWHVIDIYFHQPIVMIPLSIFDPRPAIAADGSAAAQLPGAFPWPGGVTLGSLLLVNLIAAHAKRFSLRPSRLGIVTIHSSLILLIAGQGVATYVAREAQMPIYEGQTVGWVHDIRKVELTFIQPLGDGSERVIAIDQPTLEHAARDRQPIYHPHLPFGVQVDQWMPNSRLVNAQPNLPPQATAGVGVGVTALPMDRATGVGDQQVDLPSAIITLTPRGGGEPIGRWLVSALMRSEEYLFDRQVVPVPDDPGGEWLAVLRFERRPTPYQVTLTEFRHERYPGTNTPSSYESDIVLHNPQTDETLDAQIYMNNPLYYRGETFYQASFLGGDAGTVLQVVDNPAKWVPWIACGLATAGLLWHFGYSLHRYTRRRRAQAGSARGGAA
jgi:hypothetical protein